VFIICSRILCESRFAGLSSWFAPAHDRCRGVHYELVRRALCIVAPRSTPFELFVTTVTLFGQECAEAWSLVQAASESLHAITTVWARALRSKHPTAISSQDDICLVKN
jgi:hypothetical protein